MRKTRSGLAVPALVMVSLAVGGCQAEARGVRVPPGAQGLATCSVAEIPIGELGARGEPGCDLVGTTLTFPDETAEYAVGPPSSDGAAPTLTIPAVGAVFSQGDGQGRELLIVNWGVPGVGVAAIESGRLVKLWASSEAALDLQRQQLAVENIDLG